MTAATAASAPRLPDEIKSDLKSIETTTTLTLSLLRVILGFDATQEPPDKDDSPCKATATSGKSATTKTIGAPRKPAVRKPTFEIHESTTPATPIASIKDRRRCATEVINTSLKTLNAAARPKQDKSSEAPEEKPHKTPRRVAQPLKECSPNRSAKPDRGRVRDQSGGGVQPLVHCLGVALECLRQTDWKDEKQSSFDLNTENAALVVVDKCIALGLASHAETQLRKIHDQYWKKRKPDQRKLPCPVELGSKLSACLYASEEQDAKLAKFATSFQSQCLRLLIMSGGQCVDADLLAALHRDTVGSPAWMIIKSEEMGYLDAQTCGTQLRTLSLAISKLHATATEAEGSTSPSPLQTLSLFISTLQIKCLSWKYLEHSPDLQKEVWSPLAKNLKRYHTRSVRSKDDLPLQHLQALQRALEESGICEDIPSDVLELAEDINPSVKINDTDSLVEGLLHMRLDIKPTLLQMMKAAARALTAGSVARDQEDASIDMVLQGLAEQDSVKQADLVHLLLESAHLRKQALSVVNRADDNVERTRCDGSDIKMQERAACIIYALLAFLMRIIKSSSTDSAKNICLSLAKTAEAIINLEQYSFVKDAAVLTQSRTALLRCLELSILIQAHSDNRADAAVRTFLKGLPPRISQCFWSRYRWLTQNRRSTSERIQALTDAIHVLLELEPDQRRSGNIVVKLEELSQLYVETGSHLQASDTLKSAIEFQIEQGRLADAVEASLSAANSRTWDNASSRHHSLGQTLAEFAKLGLEHGLNWCYDQQRLPLIHRAVLVERQITVILSQKSSCITVVQARSSVQAVLIHSLDSVYHNYQLRFISQTLRLLERGKLCPARDLFGYEHIGKALAEVNTTKMMLHASVSALNATVRAQWAFACGQMDEKLLGYLVEEYKMAIHAIKNQEQLRDRVHDSTICMSQIQALADYAAVLGRSELQRDALESLCRLQALCELGDPGKRIICLSYLGLLQTEAGDTTQAGKTFVEAEKLLKDNKEGFHIRIALMLNQADYLLNIANHKQCSTVLSAANATIEQYERDLSPKSTKERFERDSCLGRHALIRSRLAFDQGLLLDAFTSARKAAKLGTALWLAIEKNATPHSDARLEAFDSSLQVVTEDLSALSVSGLTEPKQQIQGAMYWPQVSLHRATLQHMSVLAAHAGLYQDALFYTRQVSQVAKQTAGHGYMMQIESELALIYAMAGDVQMATSVLAKVMACVPGAIASTQQCWTVLNLSETLWTLGDEERSQALFDKVRLFQRKLEARTVGDEPSLPINVTPRRKKLTEAALVRQSKKQLNLTKAAEKEPQTPVYRSDALSVAQTLLMGKFEAMHHRIETSVGIASAANEANLQDAGPGATVTKALKYLRQAMSVFAVDPSNSTLAETASAFPVRYRTTRKSGQLSLLIDHSLQSPLKALTPAKSMPNPSNAPNVTRANNEGCRLLVKTYSLLRNLQRSRLSELSSSMIHTMHKALSQVSLLSTALDQRLTYSPMPVVLQCFIPKDIARSRERITVAAEARIQSTASLRLEPIEDVADLINSLPVTWRIVSVGLSNDRTELLLSRISAGTTPFLMRVPIGRPGLEDVEANEFTLDYARQELVDIINSADANTHDVRGHGDKQTRKTWYAEREALDERLECLLKNIENIWLGGFRGLLSSHSVDGDLLARFGQSLTQALDKHLPSRQKASKSVVTKVELHARVLELFVTIKFEEITEFEDAITDLLYFVVDMLQFNGERNAADEIDFDELLVDVLDALRGYHHAAEAQYCLETQHTILILDKELHGIPWESLPCLRGHAIYRMPSLGAIKERIDLLRAKSAEAQTFNISTTSGAYILNPSSDLISTQETFSTIFTQQLSHFTSITDHIPTEDDFKSCLTTNNIFLYFGHGSGAQYIRGRTIRALQMQDQSCAVSWLMGCSSLKMTECGMYEPYGMPWHYLNGGCNAVVGTLWDVTDREIDRFAMQALVEWGLLKESEETQKPFARQKKRGKGKAERQGAEKERRGKMAIGEAVAVAREACLLKYLNGAAPVVYGVPVSLE